MSLEIRMKNKKNWCAHYLSHGLGMAIVLSRVICWADGAKLSYDDPLLKGIDP